jgi:hypothetical protein
MSQKHYLRRQADRRSRDLRPFIVDNPLCIFFIFFRIRRWCRSQKYHERTKVFYAASGTIHDRMINIGKKGKGEFSLFLNFFVRIKGGGGISGYI